MPASCKKNYFPIFVRAKISVLELKTYIESYLFKNKGIVIPGIGALIPKFQSARYDKENTLFLPTQVSYTFKSTIQQVPDDFIIYISEKKKISTKEASGFINAQSKTLKEQIEKGDKIKIRGAGSFIKAKKGIEFIPERQSTSLKDYGLNSIHATRFTDPQARTKNKKTRSRKTWAFYVAAGCILIFLIAGAFYSIHKGLNFRFLEAINNQKEWKNPQEENAGSFNMDSTILKDTTKAIINSVIDESTDPQKALFYQEPSDLNKDSTGKIQKYILVAGSFKSIENARTFEAQLKSKGYSTEIIHSEESTLYRVSIDAFTEEETALKELARIRAKNELSSVWIWKII